MPHRTRDPQAVQAQPLLDVPHDGALDAAAMLLEHSGVNVTISFTFGFTRSTCAMYARTTPRR